MKLKKVEKLTTLRAEFARGYVEAEKNKDFAKLYISCITDLLDDGGNTYAYWNWNMCDLKDLADAIYAFLKEKGFKG